MCRRCVTPYPTRPTRPLEHSHCRAEPPRTVRVHCEHLLVWSQCTGRTRRSGCSVYMGNPPRTVRERYARRVNLSVCTRPWFHYERLRTVRRPTISSMHSFCVLESTTKGSSIFCILWSSNFTICMTEWHICSLNSNTYRFYP